MVIPEFDITGPLPMPGTTLLEASAGTGKTWTIAALVARYVVEGVIGLDKMLVVTFGRAASQELRERVRDRLVEVEHALAAPPQGKIKDPVLAMALDADEVERGVRLRRVRRALTEFDDSRLYQLDIHASSFGGIRGILQERTKIYLVGRNHGGVKSGERQFDFHTADATGGVIAVIGFEQCRRNGQEKCVFIACGFRTQAPIGLIERRDLKDLVGIPRHCASR